MIKSRKKKTDTDYKVVFNALRNLNSLIVLLILQSRRAGGKGYGIQLVKALGEYAVEHQMTSVFLHSRHYAAGFYKKLGCSIYSEVFQEVGMDHYAMEKRIITG